MNFRPELAESEKIVEDQCSESRGADGRHSWVFDGDDPYVVCAFCSERRDALTGRPIPWR